MRKINYKFIGGDIIASILTIKQKEAEEACNTMNTKFTGLNTQIGVTHHQGFVPLEDKSNILHATEQNMLQAVTNMNNVPIQ